MIRLSVRDADFESRFAALLSPARETTETVDRPVAAIIADRSSFAGTLLSVRCLKNDDLLRLAYCFPGFRKQP
jgi:hypothetical protein